jgi:hypothetical protein
VVTWQGQDDGNDFSIFVQKFNANGTVSNNTPVQLEGIGRASGEDRVPQVSAVGSSGAFVVTWYGQDGGNDDSIFVQQFNADGTLGNNTPVPLEAIGRPNGPDQAPQVTAVGSTGAYVVTWYGVSSSGQKKPFVQKFNADGTLGSITQVKPETTYSGDDINPQVSAVGSSGAFVVTWQGTDSRYDQSIFVQQFNAGGTINNSLISNASSTRVQSTELGVAYLVNSAVAVTDLASITAAADNQWNQVAITAANTDTILAATGLADGQYRVYTADAAGNLSAVAAGTLTVDSTAPTISSISMTSARIEQNSLLNAGDVLSITVTMSEATTVTGTPQLALNIGDTSGQASYASGSGSTALVFNYTIVANQTDANGISINANSLALNGGTLTDAIGYNALLTHTAITDNASYMVDTTAPTANMTATAIANTGNAVVQSNELGTAYLVRNTETVTSLTDITSIVDANYNSVSITAANTATNLAVTDLEAGVYKLYVFDAAGNMSVVAGNTVLVTNTANASQINLTDAAVTGNEGGLIAPVYVDGQWFMYWDHSGDGTSANTIGTVFGAGTGNSTDLSLSHDDLDAIFKFGSNFTTVKPGWASGAPLDGSNDTTDTYRFSTLNGVKLALPTAPSTGNKAGTTIDNIPTGEPNTTFNDLLAIWDAHNGTTTTTGTSGVPVGWASSTSDAYWAATAGDPSVWGRTHLGVKLANGNVGSYFDNVDSYVALQVL